MTIRYARLDTCSSGVIAAAPAHHTMEAVRRLWSLLYVSREALRYHGAKYPINTATPLVIIEVGRLLWSVVTQPDDATCSYDESRDVAHLVRVSTMRIYKG